MSGLRFNRPLFHAVAFTCLITTTLLHGFIDGPYSLWWRLTQIGAWSLITNAIFVACSFFGDIRKCHERVYIKLDIFFTVCLTLAVGVFIFYVLVVLPFTPQFTINSDCHNTAHDDDCMSLGGFVVMSLVHAVPFVTSIGEMILVEHKFSFENKKVELTVLMAYVALFLTWSVLCYQLLHASPYYVQDMVGPGVSILMYILCLAFFVGMFFLVRWIHHRLWPPQTKVHYTDQLISSIEEQWRFVPAAVDYEVKTFKDSPVNVRGDGKGSLNSYSGSPRKVPSAM
mmetsp:Transcript_1611/g.2318  ORF Transcript_1611/g.2318 Transcript_1611/m.2318 type:complete len:284 (-) Transcript_1611:239-1090(-)|eukprot:CAMPEP_0184487864 /NCGR_PEP_ID=MMETSP0113_2-20130426/10379_1 /TAXON_ID=91329 /ORGANISM="Norrisiella sphaerica, Strain BC52" /LENGTH=283 /DNA_ID=CAMNT_0026870281 /DNA_START=64 /DNA_END=915 /DNA_ORIENTATION=+